MEVGNGNGKSRAKMVEVMRRWQIKIAKAAVGRSSSKSFTVPADVPQGHMAIYASYHSTVERFVIPATYANQALFRALLEKSEEVFGLNGKGPLLLPCNPLVFRHHLLPLLTTNAQLTTAEIQHLLSHSYIYSSSSSSCAISSCMEFSKIASSTHSHSAASSYSTCSQYIF